MVTIAAHCLLDQDAVSVGQHAGLGDSMLPPADSVAATPLIIA